MTYLINNEGRMVHKWSASQYPPGQSVYLMENGNLLRTCMTKGQLSSGGGEGAGLRNMTGMTILSGAWISPRQLICSTMISSGCPMGISSCL
jgi:hypothetical protein